MNASNASTASSIIRLVLLLVAVFALPASCVYMQINARDQANAFCARAVIGAPLEPIAKDAENAGIRILRRISKDQVSVGFSAMAYSRFICTINAQDGRIISARVSHLD